MYPLYIICRVVLFDIKNTLNVIFYFFRYIKPNSKKRKRSASDTEDFGNEDESDANSAPLRYGKNQDLYGCVAFEPALSETESKETQEMKKITLLEQFNKEEPDIEVIKKLLDDTYPSQRVCINRRERHHLNLENILKSHWPHLKKKSYFLAHADTLLGKKVQEVWNQNIELKVSEIVSYFRRPRRI